MRLSSFLYPLFILTSSSPSLPSPVQSTIITCGCDDCTSDILATLAGQYPCGDRITYLINNDLNYSELDACRKVAGEEFPFICGPMCDPDKCNSTPSPITPSPTYPPVAPPSSLYCFPNDDGVSRVTYSNMWTNDDNNEGYQVQVKEGDICGPGGNRFSRNTVSVKNDELTLQFKLNGDTNTWEASEVRVTQSNGQPYKYGQFTFHVQSVSVKDSSNGGIISDVLPTNMVLGLFTWDPTDRYELNENWNHEVDVEISRWGSSTNADTQFLVQPPGSPQMYRFYSGTDPNTYQQSNQWHSFRWLPNKIDWTSTAGGGHSHSYSTEQAITYGLEDYVQCLPADVEIRINLWSTDGLNIQPIGLTNDQYVEVVIGQFAYFEAEGVQYASPGDYCSKHCQCEAELGCVNGQCIDPTPTAVNPTTLPSGTPSISPTTQITIDPTPAPTTISPTTLSSNTPSISPTNQANTIEPTTSPTIVNPSILPTSYPSLSPTTQTSPTPSTVGSECYDSSIRFKVIWNGRAKFRDCTWVSNRATKLRCEIENVAGVCPGTCSGGICATCEDSSIRFMVDWNGKRIARNCSWVANKASLMRCALSGVPEVCRKTCGLCEE